MAIYKKGDLTKKKILNNTKKLFYELGYNKTRMQEIADLSDIALGTLTYHYKTKENITGAILTEYLLNMYEHVKANVDKEINTLELHFYASIPFYENLIDEENTRRFYMEYCFFQSTRPSYYGAEDFRKLLTDVYHQTIYEYHLNTPKRLIDISQLYNHGGRIKVLIEYLKGSFPEYTTADLSNFFITSRDILVGIPKEELERIGNDAIEFSKKVDFSHITPLSYNKDSMS